MLVPSHHRPSEHFEWPSAFYDDATWDSFKECVDVRKFDWNMVVWWNRTVAEATRVWHQQKTIGYLWDPFDDMRSSLTTHGAVERFTYLVARLPRTELRCAEQLAFAVRHVIKANVTHRPSTWMVYDCERGVWRAEGEGDAGVAAVVISCIEQFGRALGRACDVARTMLEIVEPDPGPKPDINQQGVTQQDIDEWEEATANRKVMNDALKPAREMARSIPRGKYAAIRAELKTALGTETTAWNSNMDWLILRDGVINVKDVWQGRGVTLHPHSPDYMSTMALDVAWEDETRNAGKSEWERGVAKVLPNEDVRKYLQKRFGAALLGTPGIADKSMVWQFGPGDTAKSTLQECIAGTNGVFAPYSLVADGSTLSERSSDKGAGERFKAYARGKRFVLMSELRDGEMLDQGLVKSITGGESVQGTAKFQNAVSFFFTATLFMASNHPPTFPPGDTALVGRIHVVPFEHRLWIQTKNPKEWSEAPPDHRADVGWKERILDSAQERRAIFNWVLDGLEAFGREGLGDLPEAMIVAREDFASDADPVGRLVRTLLGTEPSYDGAAWIRILPDAEWEAEGLYEGDGVTKARLEELINARAKELGLVKPFDDGLSPKWIRNALRMVHELGGRKKIAMVDRETRRTGMVFSRVLEVTGVTVGAQRPAI